MNQTLACSPGNASVKLAVLGNADLLRIIGEYIKGIELPFILSMKPVRDALKPLNSRSGEKWIKSEKRYFVTSVSMVEWAQSLGCKLSFDQKYNSLFTYAASNGSVDVLRSFHQKYPPYQYPAAVSRYVCAEAAANGHKEVLEYLQSLGTIVQWDKFVSGFAARGGHLHVLQWLREVLDPPCPWNSNVCDEAAYHGHLHVLQWLRAQNPPCPWSKDTCLFASREGYLEVLKWLRYQDPPCPWWKQRSIDVARYNNHHEIVEWILSQPE